MSQIDLSLVDWSRAQFALTAIYHWLFVPLTLGLSFIIAIMETIYFRTGKEEWKQITKFWMILFGINFVIGAATGIILEFEFGTNWSNYSWIVGDIFGAPLAIEGILAFFLETTFIVVMLLGWNKVSKSFHLISTWLVVIGSNLSALWILVANAWMDYPVGMHFNPDTARSEMLNFWSVLFSPVAMDKFFHTITSSYVVASLFVLGISAWFILKKRHFDFAKKSMMVAAIFGLISILLMVFAGDGSAYQVAQKQPMKLAAIEGLYNGQKGAGLILFGIHNSKKTIDNNEKDFIFRVDVPKALSLLGYRTPDAFVPGVKDLVYGNKENNIMSADEKIQKGKTAIQALANYREAKKYNDQMNIERYEQTFKENYKFIGWGYLPDKKSIIPDLPLLFYSFHLMVGLGVYFLILFSIVLFLLIRKNIEENKFILRLALWSIPLGYLASELGWVVAEVGRQPWAIQDILPTMISTSHLNVLTVQTTFFLFLILFTALLIVEIRIMIRQIKIGPKEIEN